MKGRDTNSHLKWKDNRKVNSFVGMLIPLYLVMLAFFVILCSLSTPVATKKQNVIDSLNGQFKELSYREKVDSTLPERLAMVRKLFSDPSAFGPVEAEIDHESIKMPVKLTQLYNSETSHLVQNRQVFLLKLVSQLLDQHATFKLRCVIGFKKQETKTQELAMLQAGYLAHFLLANGAPIAQVEIGISSEQPDTIQFIFEPHEKERTHERI
ncbi:MAG: hypothetical protein IPP74_05310 [Alphaproteobacteria bacterium]|nr:hypothetical protein [Alphaproteobacteria bacterium]